VAAFEYEALDGEGRVRKGLVTADHARQVRQQLREQGLSPVSVSEVRDQRAESPGAWRTRGRISPGELSVITRQFATLVGSGLTIEDSLRALTEQTESHNVRRILSGVRSQVMEGSTLADALGRYPRAFPDIYRASINAGEQSGRLDEVLERLADFTETTQTLRRRVGQSLIYPAFLVSVSLIIVAFLFTYVVPKVVRVFEDTGQQLPWLTKLFIAISAFLQHYGLLLIAGAALAVAAAVWTLRFPGPRYALDRMWLRTPGVRRFVRALNTARMARTLAIMVGSGVPLLTAMKSSGGVVGNLPMRDAITRAAEEVGEGVSLNRALARSRLFPPILVQMIASGEASGRLGTMLEKGASAQEFELESRLTMFVSIFEPLMIVVMGGIVLLIVLAVLLPIFDISQIIT